MAGPTHFPTRAHVLVCTGPSCRRRGARPLFAALWQAADERRLAYYAGGSLRLTESGCQGACDHGPNAIVYRQPGEEPALEQAWYAGVSEDSGLALLEALHAGGALPPDGRYD